MNLKIFRIDLSTHFLEDMQAIIANFSKVVAIKDISYQYTLKGERLDSMTVSDILCDHGYYCSPRQVQEALELEN